MRLVNNSTRTTKEIFDKFADPEEYTFAKTIAPVRLGQYEGEKLISRSRAKRLIFRFEKFRTVILDFDGIEEIGQALSDEVFIRRIHSIPWKQPSGSRTRSSYLLSQVIQRKNQGIVADRFFQISSRQQQVAAITDDVFELNQHEPMPDKLGERMRISHFQYRNHQH